MKFTAIAAVAAATFAATAAPAAAQDMGDEPMWNGGYVGLSVGMGAQSNDRTEGLVFDTNLDGIYGDTVRTTTGANAFSPGFCGGTAVARTPGEGCTNDRDRIEFSLRAGEDVQFGNFVAGVVLDGGTNRSRDSAAAFSTTPAFYTLTRTVDYGFGLRVRGGYAARGALFYGTAGPAWARLKHDLVTSNGANSFNGNTLADRQKTGAFGYSYGGGAEVKVARNFALGLEYLFTRYHDDDYDVRVGPGTAAATNPFLLANPAGTNMRRSDRNFDLHNIRVTASYRF
jgi:outer membrane immunogenic protein